MKKFNKQDRYVSCPREGDVRKKNTKQNKIDANVFIHPWSGQIYDPNHVHTGAPNAYDRIEIKKKKTMENNKFTKERTQTVQLK